MESSTERAWPKGRTGRRTAWLAVLLLGLSVPGCDRDPTGRDGTLPARDFIEIIVALRTADRELANEAHADSVEIEYEARRAAILEEYGASEADLHAFVERHHARPGLMAAVWDSIAQRLRTPPDDLGDIPPIDDSQ